MGAWESLVGQTKIYECLSVTFLLPLQIPTLETVWAQGYKLGSYDLAVGGDIKVYFNGHTRLADLVSLHHQYVEIGWEFFMLLCTLLRLGSTSCSCFMDASILFSNTILLPLLDWWIVNQESMRISHPYIVLSTGIVNNLDLFWLVDDSHPTRRWLDFLLSCSQVGEHNACLTCLPMRQMWFCGHYGRHCYHGFGNAESMPSP
jgi:hypothetical protein